MPNEPNRTRLERAADFMSRHNAKFIVIGGQTEYLDEAFTGKRIREWPADPGTEPVIARQKSERAPGDEANLNREAYRRRGLVECSIA